MGAFLRSTDIKSTRKVRRCFACNGVIDKGNKAVEWVSIGDGSVASVYLHPECWKATEDYCFGCKNCDDGDGFQEGFLKESMDNGSRCKGVRQWLCIGKELKEAIKI